jgi:cellulase/cellobiase CelA1
VRFTFANGQQVTQFWSSTLTQTGAGVVATNLSWNASPTPAAPTTFGFVASWNGTNAAPSPTCAAA